MQHEERISRAERRAMMLFGQIVAELDPEKFSLAEIWDEFGRHSGLGQPRERTPRREGDLGFWTMKPRAELQMLVGLGYIEKDENLPDCYCITEKGRLLAEQP